MSKVLEAISGFFPSFGVVPIDHRLIGDAKRLRDGIMKGRKTGGRSEEKIFDDCIHGLAAEYFVQQYGAIKSLEYQYDVKLVDTRVEIKKASWKKSPTYKDGNTTINTNTLRSALANESFYDYLALMEIDKHDGVFIVKPIWWITAQNLDCLFGRDTKNAYNSYFKSSIARSQGYCLPQKGSVII
jgi:hypothetical protein